MTLTVIPMPFNRLEDSEGGINIVPLVYTIINFRRALIWPEFPFARHTFQNVIGNIILFIPLGLFLPFFSYKYRSLIHVIVLASICSCSIEIIQLIERFFGIYRFVDIDDLILNTTGAILGCIIINNLVLKHDKTPGRTLKNW
jgi:glycopeptide antibiotics resistance protein